MQYFCYSNNIDNLSQRYAEIVLKIFEVSISGVDPVNPLKYGPGITQKVDDI